MTRPLPPVEKVAGGVWSVPVVVPDNPIGWTQVYVLESDRGPYLVDAGWDHEDAWEGLVTGLRETGTEVGDVQGVLVTHHHPDHLGLTGRVREASGCWVGLHAADAALVDEHRTWLTQDPEGLHSRTASLLAACGASAQEADDLIGAARALDLRLPPRPDRELVDGATDLVPGRTVRVVHTPGHSPGSVCLHLPDEDLLLTGDHLLSTITPHVGLYGFEDDDADPLRDFLASLRRTAAIDPLDVAPAHRGRFTDAPARVAYLLDHHEERLLELRAVLAGGPLTPWQVCLRMTWNRPWEQVPVLMRRSALAEVMAHVRYLVHDGVLALDDGPPVLVRTV